MSNVVQLPTVVVRYSPEPGISRCIVGSKPSPWSTYLDWNWSHRWPRGQRATGRCMNCGFSLKELTL